jgi:hypothetical protein
MAACRRQALDWLQRDIGLGCETVGERGEQVRAQRPLIRFAGDADEKGGACNGAFGVHGGAIALTRHREERSDEAIQ